MREIKFRLLVDDKIVEYEKWYPGIRDKDSGQWTAFSQWLYSPDNKEWFSGKALTIFCNRKEQYTGLKDKNGREIYEGDVVRLERSVKYSGNRGDIGAVEADPVELGYLVMRGYSLSRLTEPRAAHFVVIGNIHETPELLA